MKHWLTWWPVGWKMVENPWNLEEWRGDPSGSTQQWLSRKLGQRKVLIGRIVDRQARGIPGYHPTKHCLILKSDDKEFMNPWVTELPEEYNIVSIEHGFLNLKNLYKVPFYHKWDYYYASLKLWLTETANKCQEITTCKHRKNHWFVSQNKRQNNGISWYNCWPEKTGTEYWLA